MTKDATIVAGAINLQGPALTVWFSILDYAASNELSKPLMDAVLRDNPSCADLFAAYLADLVKGERPTPELPGATTDGRVNAARAGFDAVNRQSHDIQSELATGNGLATVIGLIDTLAAYKNLHDQLQSFQYSVGSFHGLFVAAHGIDTDLEQVRVLRKFLTQLRLLCQSARQWVNVLPQSPGLRDFDEVWLKQLNDAAESLQDAVDTKSPAAYEPLFEVRGVLRVVPLRLNQQIFVTAKSLPFEVLANGLDAIVRKLPAGDLAIAPIESAHDAILILSSTIKARVREHGLWQDVDHKLSDLMELIEPSDRVRTDATTDPTLPFQFAPLWRSLKPKMQTLVDLDPDGRWRPQLDEYSTGVSDQLAREVVDTAFILAFEAYRDEAQQRFVEVDLALKSECASLVRIGEPLHKILEELKP